MKHIKAELLTKKVYSKPLREWKRLTKDPFHKLEFETTLHFLKKYLPKKGLILDAGGGPGRYTIELAKQGYDVILFDITPENLEFAKKQIKKAKAQHKVKGIIEGSIVDLSKFSDGTFDAVICLGGPISHISEEKFRKRAVDELVRVAKKNAPIFISVFGKFSTLSIAPKFFPEEIRMTEHFNRLVSKGDDYHWHGKYYGHFFTSEELGNLIRSNKKVSKNIKMVALEGLSSPMQKEINKLYKDSKAWKNWIKMHYATCTHPTVVDMSLHIMIILKKK